MWVMLRNWSQMYDMHLETINQSMKQFDKQAYFVYLEVIRNFMCFIES